MNFLEIIAEKTTDIPKEQFLDYVNEFDTAMSLPQNIAYIKSNPQIVPRIRTIIAGIIDMYVSTLTYMAIEKFNHLTVIDLLDVKGYNFLQHNSVSGIIDVYHLQFHYVMQQILNEKNHNKRTLIIERWIFIADELTKLKNFFSAQAIIYALLQMPILRLIQNNNQWIGLTNEAIKTLEKLQSLYSYENVGRDKLNHTISEHDGAKLSHVDFFESILIKVGGIIESKELEILTLDEMYRQLKAEKRLEKNIKQQERIDHQAINLSWRQHKSNKELDGDRSKLKAVNNEIKKIEKEFNTRFLAEYQKYVGRNDLSLRRKIKKLSRELKKIINDLRLQINQQFEKLLMARYQEYDQSHFKAHDLYVEMHQKYGAFLFIERIQNQSKWSYERTKLQEKIQLGLIKVNDEINERLEWLNNQLKTTHETTNAYEKSLYEASRSLQKNLTTITLLDDLGKMKITKPKKIKKPSKFSLFYQQIKHFFAPLKFEFSDESDNSFSLENSRRNSDKSTFSPDEKWSQPQALVNNEEIVIKIKQEEKWVISDSLTSHHGLSSGENSMLESYVNSYVNSRHGTKTVTTPVSKRMKPIETKNETTLSLNKYSIFSQKKSTQTNQQRLSVRELIQLFESPNNFASVSSSNEIRKLKS